MNNGTISIDNGDQFVIQTNTKVQATNTIIVVFPGGEEEELKVTIEADFKDLKPEHHELFLDRFAYKYANDVKIWNTHMNYDGSPVPVVEGKTVPKRRTAYEWVKYFLLKIRDEKVKR